MNAYMRSRSSLGRESSKLNEGSDEGACDVVDGLLVEGFRRRTGRLGDFGGASSMAVSEEPLLPVEDCDRDRDRGVEVREAISFYFRRQWWWYPCGRVAEAKGVEAGFAMLTCGTEGLLSGAILFMFGKLLSKF
jgi:hypothetical protein